MYNSIFSGASLYLMDNGTNVEACSGLTKWCKSISIKSCVKQSRRQFVRDLFSRVCATSAHCQRRQLNTTTVYILNLLCELKQIIQHTHCMFHYTN